MDQLSIGIDVGTSGCRAVALDGSGTAVAEASSAMAPPHRNGNAIDQDPAIWWSTVEQVLASLLDQIDRAAVRAIAVDGTSGTLLLTDAVGTPLGPGLMYNDTRAAAEAAEIAAIAPATSGALGASSALAKLLYLTARGGTAKADHALHQADWTAAKLSGRFGLSDQNNALKLGYDVVEQRWPQWLQTLGIRHELLPEVLVPGAVIGPIAKVQAEAFGLPSDVLIVAGTTDGVAAFLATGAADVGDAVTSLGSTLVVKQLSDRPLFDAASGVYSHRLGDLWLPGGASNSGGAALACHFDLDAIQRLTPMLQADVPTGLDYYPLQGKGERFPISDPAKPSITEPRPVEDAVFLQGLLEGIARIEAQAYERLCALGGPPLKRVLTVGGGAANPAWTGIRRRTLGVDVIAAETNEAAFGAARLARQGYENFRMGQQTL